MTQEHSPLRPTDIKMMEGLVEGAFYDGVSSGMDEHRKFNGGKSWDETIAFKKLETLRDIFLKAVNRDSAFDDLVKALEAIAKSAPTIDPDLDPSVSFGNGDDQFYDGMTQQRWHDAEIARAALAKAKAVSA